MLIGELNNKIAILNDAIRDLQLYFDSIEKVDDNSTALLKLFDDTVLEYENCTRNLWEVLFKTDVDIGNGKKVNIDRLFVLERSLKSKIELITGIIRNKSYDYDGVLNLVNQKDSLCKELIYVSSLINKKIWSTEIDN